MLNYPLMLFSSPQFEERARYAYAGENGVMYLCGNSLITFIFENEELKKINLHDKEDLFPSIAVARVFNIRSEGMNETQSAISMSMEEGSFETELCTVSYNNLVGLEFTLI